MALDLNSPSARLQDDFRTPANVIKLIAQAVKDNDRDQLLAVVKDTKDLKAGAMVVILEQVDLLNERINQFEKDFFSKWKSKGGEKPHT